jgi:hypothetical protein
MAQHTLTHLVTRIEAAGGTADQLLALTDVEMAGGEVFAWNRRAESAAYSLVDRVERNAASPAAAPTDEPLATERQVAYIIKLLGQRQRNGDEGGFMSLSGPINADTLAKLTRREASTYITSLTESY